MTYSGHKVEEEPVSPLIGAYQVAYRGRQAHAAAHPWDGRSAFDALQMAFYGTAFFEKRCPPTVRVLYDQIDSGGSPPNVVPERAEAWFYLCCMRGRQELAASAGRLERVLQGAALMTGTTVECRLRDVYPGGGGDRAAAPLIKRLYEDAVRRGSAE